MKTSEEINAARSKLIRLLLNPHLGDYQNACLQGMLTALVWAADGEHSATMDLIMSGEPIVEQPNV